MLSELLAIIAPIMISVAVGFIWGKSGQDFPADFISRLVMNIGTPCLIIGAMARVELQPDVIGQVALATTLVMTAMGILGWGLVRALKLDIATYLPPLVFPNNGNMGLPLCLFAYGQTGLALALGSFMVMMIATFTVGLLVVATDEGSLWKRMASIARQPVIYAMAIAVVLLVTGTALPRWIGNTLDLLGNIAIPLMTIALGVSLATLRIHSLPRSVFFSLVRMLGGLLLGWLACELLEVTGVARSVVLLQSAMPIAVFNYLLALRYNHNPQEVAAMVLVSTLLAFMGLPFLLLVIL